MSPLTAKAAQALTTLHTEGWHCQITSQMIDRLHAAKLIDFDTTQGWHLTPIGTATLTLQTDEVTA
jgi:Mn-dependent DtxR family transcriptional regulator